MQRRVFLKSGALALVTMGLSPTFLRRAIYAQGLPAGKKGKVLICLFQRGAADGLNILVPHGESEYYALRPSIGIARGSVIDAGAIGKLKAMIRRACQVQLDGTGFAIVEVLSNCPVGWGMSAPESVAHLAKVAETYPLGLILDRAKGIGLRPAQAEA